MTKIKRMIEARILYSMNKEFVGENIDSLSIEEKSAYCRLQDKLYLIMIGER